MSTDIQPTGQPFDADQIDVALAEVTENVDHAEAPYNPWALQALRAADALRGEVGRLNKRLNDAHEALTRVEDDDPDEFVSLESTVEWVVTHYRALRKDFDELHDMLGTDGAS